MVTSFDTSSMKDKGSVRVLAMNRRRKQAGFTEDEEEGLFHDQNVSVPTTSTKNKSYPRQRAGLASYHRFYQIGFSVISLLVIIGYSIFSILHVALRSRPIWLYGKPTLMIQDNISSCLMDDPTLMTSQSPAVLWEWHNFTNSAGNLLYDGPKTNSRQTRLLIAQYSGFGEYAKFLNLISPVHQKYAKQHGYDYVILQGTLLNFPGIQQDCFSNVRATFDKIPLLVMAETLKDKYDYVLVLDTDAMIVNHDVATNNQWSEVLPPNQLLAAERVIKLDWSNTWDINAGVTLWNLHHPDFENLVNRWKILSQYGTADDGIVSYAKQRAHLETILTKNDDQYFLQTALLETYTWWNRPVVALNGEFNYYDGTLVKHFKRDKRSWSTSGLEQRLERAKEVIRKICMSQLRGTDYCSSKSLFEDIKSEFDYAKREPPSQP